MVVGWYKLMTFSQYASISAKWCNIGSLIVNYNYVSFWIASTLMTLNETNIPRTHCKILLHTWLQSISWDDGYIYLRTPFSHQVRMESSNLRYYLRLLLMRHFQIILIFHDVSVPVRLDAADDANIVFPSPWPATEQHEWSRRLVFSIDTADGL